MRASISTPVRSSVRVTHSMSMRASSLTMVKLRSTWVSEMGWHSGMISLVRWRP